MAEIRGAHRMFAPEDKVTIRHPPPTKCGNPAANPPQSRPMLRSSSIGEKDIMRRLFVASTLGLALLTAAGLGGAASAMPLGAQAPLEAAIPDTNLLTPVHYRRPYGQDYRRPYYAERRYYAPPRHHWRHHHRSWR